MWIVLAICRVVFLAEKHLACRNFPEADAESVHKQAAHPGG